MASDATKDEHFDTQSTPTPADSARGTKRNAFTELMSSKKKAPAPPEKPAVTPSSGAQAAFYSRPSLSKSFRDRDGLGIYTENPASFPASRVIYHNDNFVAIHDMYPKSSVHTLLLPRPPKSQGPSPKGENEPENEDSVVPDRTRLHPFDAFDDPVFLASVRAETAKLRRLVAKELQRLYGPSSAQDRAREAVLNGETPDEETEAGASSSSQKENNDDPAEMKEQQLPKGRDWEREVVVGVHAHPSMNDLHVHVLSRDMVSRLGKLKNKKHYNSFNTKFLVNIDDFPLPAEDPRRHPGREGYLKADLVCWRCGGNFGNKFALLKKHIEEVEFPAWKSE